MPRFLVYIVILPVATAFILLSGQFPTVGRSMGSTRNSFIKAGNEPKCSDCHGELLGKKTVHAAASGGCENCHSIDIREHTESSAKGLKLFESLPGLCYKCHEDVKKDILASNQLHSALRLKSSCTSCHSPHSSDNEKLLYTELNKQCLNCHNKDVSATGRPVVNMKTLIANSKVIHPPVRDDACVVCHKAHAAENNNLLNNSFPVGNYAAKEAAAFGICWDCHDIDLFREPKTTTATNFRNGEKNLHFIHLNSGTSRSCIMCHNVHGSPNEHLIEDKVKFGQWNLPVRYTPTKNGGSCFPGCHVQKSYSR